MMRYDEPQLRCVSIVERYAANSEATSSPFMPTGSSVSIAGYARSLPMSAGFTCGNARWMSASVGNTSIEQSATMIHGHGLSA